MTFAVGLSQTPCDDTFWQLVVLRQAVATNASSFWISFRGYRRLVLCYTVLQTACHPSRRLTPPMKKHAGVRASLSRHCAVMLLGTGKHDLLVELASIGDSPVHRFQWSLCFQTLRNTARRSRLAGTFLCDLRASSLSLASKLGRDLIARGLLRLCIFVSASLFSSELV